MADEAQPETLRPGAAFVPGPRRSLAKPAELLVAFAVLAAAGIGGMIDLGNAGYFRMEDPSLVPLQVPFWVIPAAAAAAVTLLTGWHRTLRWRAGLAIAVGLASAVAWFPTVIIYFVGWALLMWIGVLPS